MDVSSTRSQAYRVARDLGNVEAAQRSIQTRSASPLLKREVRRVMFRETNKTLGHGLRDLGI
jgi:hypothetical protein